METEDVGLTDKQLMAVDLVLYGMSDKEVAERIGKSRQTVNRWRLHDMEFCALLTKRRKEIREHHRDNLNNLVSKALGVVNEAMDVEDIGTRLQAAQTVLRMSGLRTLMQNEPVPTKDEILREFIGKMIANAARKQGLYDVKELPGE